MMKQGPSPLEWLRNIFTFDFLDDQAIKLYQASGMIDVVKYPNENHKKIATCSTLAYMVHGFANPTEPSLRSKDPVIQAAPAS